MSFIINMDIPDVPLDYEPLSPEEILDVEEGLADIKAGRARPYEEVAREMGLRSSDE